MHYPFYSFSFDMSYPFNPLPRGTTAAFFLKAVGLIQHTKEGNIGGEKTIQMT
jgi:hypothetical protein